MGENTNVIFEKQEQVNGPPEQKHVEVACEEMKFTWKKIDECQANQNGAHCEREEIASNTTRRIMEITVDATEPDSDMSMSPSKTRNSPIHSEYPSDRILAHQDNYFSNPVHEPCTSPIERLPYEDYIRDVEYGVASVEKHLAFSADDVGVGLRVRIPDLKELNGVNAGCLNSNLYGPASSGTGGSFYRNENLESYPMDYRMENTGFARRNGVTGVDVEDGRMYGGCIRDNHNLSVSTATDIRAQIRTYGGHTGNDQPQTPIYPTTDIRAQIRMYGQQSTHTSGYPGYADAHGVSSLGSSGRPTMDRYTPHLQENHATGMYGVPGNRSELTPDPLNFTSRQQYPCLNPSPFADWHG
jgi:hypothetical protein